MSLTDPQTSGGQRTAILHSDGASWGNPGESGIAYVLKDGRGRELAAEARYIGKATNNVAEYRALIAGLEKARSLGIEELDIRLDSELVVSQLNGSYRVRAAHLYQLYTRALALLTSFPKVAVRHVPRSQNSRADALAAGAIKGALQARRQA
ncbi:MAG: ribonuclease HI family protein [Chloroflexi bacterium]|nr:ribonuclease HI family protein [Chloroflexota bacterium]MCL5110190.1 ribonuclease HI family protein [Chloroflexota bacterium]